MKLVHFSANPVAAVRSTSQPWTEGAGVGKPQGFWITDMDCEANWLSWSRSESFHLEALRYAHDVSLSDQANILFLRTPEDIDRFTDTHGTAALYPGGRREWIDWEPTCRAYHGIIISPYIWKRRLDGPTWYYTWDCASGCIWDKKAIGVLGLPADTAILYPEDTPEDASSEAA